MAGSEAEGLILVTPVLFFMASQHVRCETTPIVFLFVELNRAGRLMSYFLSLLYEMPPITTRLITQGQTCFPLRVSEHLHCEVIFLSKYV